MGKHSTIEWLYSENADGKPNPTYTWNPWMGCNHVSSGCKNCYAERDMRGYDQVFTQVRRSKTRFKDPLKWDDPGRCFACSWSDWFHPRADRWRDEAWDIIAQTPHINYIILTKRSGRIMDHLPVDWDPHGVYSHVWLGASVENQATCYRLDDLTAVPANRRVVSVEPMIGPVNIEPWAEMLDWVICGGESGRHWGSLRAMNPKWALVLRDQCVDFGIPFLFKQVGGVAKVDGSWGGNQLDGKQYLQWPGGPQWLDPRPKQRSLF